MPRNFSELKSGGGDNSYVGGTRPPRPPPIDARGHVHRAAERDVMAGKNNKRVFSTTFP